ncbi:hypothetical protein M378DRAFT_820645 [Amanita muscaria Koide BX008]|uniref:Uncharacterized protein n=1 Tax=Amanita muscaria (strain Koide BX008) TaxID=946122 RepID=A0A0C2SF97_AMAMK|nr:hypothetical protein M378DRAFT_820645 [Amanita muscaria Koide BX008]
MEKNIGSCSVSRLKNESESSSFPCHQRNSHEPIIDNVVYQRSAASVRYDVLATESCNNSTIQFNLPSGSPPVLLFLTAYAALLGVALRYDNWHICEYKKGKVESSSMLTMAKSNETEDIDCIGPGDIWSWIRIR